MKVLPLPCKWLDLCMAWVTMLLFSTEAPLGYTNKNFHPPPLPLHSSFSLFPYLYGQESDYVKWQSHIQGSI